MLIFPQLFDPASSTYTYLLGDAASGEALIIDPVFEHERRDVALLRELGLRLIATLDTHVHADHVTGAWRLKQRCGSQILLAEVAQAQNVDRGLRDLAKPIRLGLQYYMRAETLQLTALRDYGLEIPLADCERYEADFRAANKRTVDFWGRLIEAFAARHGKPWYAMHLPSGRAIYYWEPEAGDGWKLSASAVKGGERYPYHAGTLAENIASGTSRDILSLAAVRCADDGYLPVLSVHDELVFEVPEEAAEHSKAEITRIMQTPPPWPLADRLPLEVEAHVANRYGK